MSLFSSLFHPGRAYQDALNTSNDYYNQAQGYIAPYNQNAQNAYGNLSQAMQDLMNPQGLYDRFNSSYNESDAARLASEQARNAGLDAASAQGLLGSTAATSAIQQGENNILANDRQNYLNQLMQMYMNGTGLANNIYNTGAGAANNMGQNAINQGQTNANLTYGAESAPGNSLMKLLGIGGGVLGSAIGGGWNPFGGK